MNRRRFFTALAALAAAPLALARPAPAPIQPRRIRLQESPLAGFQYHQGDRLWPRLREGPNPWGRIGVAVELELKG